MWAVLLHSLSLSPTSLRYKISIQGQVYFYSFLFDKLCTLKLVFMNTWVRICALTIMHNVYKSRVIRVATAQWQTADMLYVRYTPGNC